MDNLFGAVQRRSSGQIEGLAGMVRHHIGADPGARLPMQPILDNYLDDIVEDAYLVVERDCAMMGAEGRTDWYQPVITLSETTYRKLCAGNPRARMTAAHELGHLLMHYRNPVFSYRTASRDPRVDPEWQANRFAAALLMPAQAFYKMRSIDEAQATFGVSFTAALHRARDLRVRLSGGGASSPSKKKGHGMHRTP